MKARTSRRTALRAILAAPFASASATAAIATSLRRPAPPSDLAAVCEWAANQWQTMPARCRAEDWDDDRLDLESDLYYAVFLRALAEPAHTLADLKAKARLCIVDLEAQLFPFVDPAENPEPEDSERLALMVLRELIALREDAA